LSWDDLDESTDTAIATKSAPVAAPQKNDAPLVSTQSEPAASVATAQPAVSAPAESASSDIMERAAAALQQLDVAPGL
ncbi:hypothetical protein RJJ65_40475, partial [Rhizobium hidalgonense]